jgi:hypothetical protein
MAFRRVPVARAEAHAMPALLVDVQIKRHAGPAQRFGKL